MSLVTLAPGLVSAAAITGSATGDGEAALARPIRVECDAPRSMRLRRFEDRSAQLLCGRRVIVRISVPG